MKNRNKSQNTEQKSTMSRIYYSNFTKIGQGAYGTVYKAVTSTSKIGPDDPYNKDTNPAGSIYSNSNDTIYNNKENQNNSNKKADVPRIVAVKKLKYTISEEGITSPSLREISTLKKLKHPNIVHLIEVFIHQDALHLVFPFYETDLKQYMNSYLSSDSQIPDKIIKHFARQMLHALSYLHENNIIHRDVKPQNFLINNKGVIVLADFGLNKVIGSHYKLFSKDVITLFYRAPEILLGSRYYSESVDIWSLGCVFLELILLKVIFKGKSEVNQLEEIFKILGTPTEKEWMGVESLINYSSGTFYRRKDLKGLIGGDPLFIDLIEKMLCYDPLKRISACDALDHVFFRD